MSTWYKPALAVAATALLAACSMSPQRPAPVATPARIDAPAPPAPAPAPLPTPVATPDPSPWVRLAARFEMPGCDYSAEVMRWAIHYTRSPQRFAASWKPALPFLLLVLDEIERRQLPGEFGLLPYVESRYRPLDSKGNLPAGMWQLMPVTARERGLRIDRDYDGRLDAIDATRVALELIERYDREFGDWRLATMAFNAGEFRVKRQLAGRNGASLDAAALARLDLSAITHDHLERMLALACIIADPMRFNVELPLPERGDRVIAHALDGSIDLRVAARIAGMPLEDLRRFNAAHRGARTANGSPPRLLLPEDHLAAFVEASTAHPRLLQAQWRSSPAKRTLRLAELATDSPLDAHALALANGIAPDATVAAGTELLLVAEHGDHDPAAPVPASTPAAQHVVQAGDTLSAIARRYRVRVSELLGWNALRAKTTLRLGMRLRVSSP